MCTNSIACVYTCRECGVSFLIFDQTLSVAARTFGYRIGTPTARTEGTEQRDFEGSAIFFDLSPFFIHFVSVGVGSLVDGNDTGWSLRGMINPLGCCRFFELVTNCYLKCHFSVYFSTSFWDAGYFSFFFSFGVAIQLDNYVNRLRKI